MTSESLSKAIIFATWRKKQLRTFMSEHVSFSKMEENEKRVTRIVTQSPGLTRREIQQRAHMRSDEFKDAFINIDGYTIEGKKGEEGKLRYYLKSC